MPRKPLHRHLYFWVLVSIVLGIVMGIAFPHQAAGLKWLSDIFVSLIKMVIAPTIFCTVVVGIARLESLAKAGKLALRTLLYFIGLTVFALALGLVVVNLVRPGAGLNLTPHPADAHTVLGSTMAADHGGIAGFVKGLVPDSMVGAFTEGKVIQVLLVAILVAVSVSFMGEQASGVIQAIDTIGKVMFGIIRVLTYLAPVGAFGGMAYTVGMYGGKVLGGLATLLGTYYLTCTLFVFLILGSVSRLAGFNIVKFLRLIKDEILIVLGTSSSETVLPRIMGKLEAAGARRSVVGMVIPTGYSFNLDGTCIYLTMGALFIAQATGTHVPLGTQLALLAFMLISSKGAAGVSGAALVTLAASLSSFGNNAIPAVGIALLVGVDRLMGETRGITNLIGNSVATMVIARWQGDLDTKRFHQVLDDPSLINVNDSQTGVSENLQPSVPAMSTS